MIECGATPRYLRVTRQTIVTELSLLMIRIRRVVERRRMTIPARMRQILILIVDVALTAIRCLMRANQLEVRRAVIERRRSPHSRVVARRTVLCKARKNVPRILRLIVLRLMTLLTVIIERKLVVVVDVTLLALRCRMSSRQRKLRRVVVERCRSPAACGVTLHAARAEVSLNVIRIG